jgi:hypothetical protein
MTPMGQKTVRFSDLSEQLINSGSDVVRVVVHEHPELDGQPVELEAHVDEARLIMAAGLQVAVVDVYASGQAEPQRVTLDAAAFDKLATARPMAELLIAAPPARRAPRPAGQPRRRPASPEASSPASPPASPAAASEDA